MDFTNTKQKGTFAEAQCIAKMYKLGYEVSLPVGDRMSYDLIVDTGESLKKVQCKYAGKYERDGHVVDLRRTGGNKSGSVTKKYEETAFDLLYVLTEEGNEYLIDWADVSSAIYLKLDSSKYSKYKI